MKYNHSLAFLLACVSSASLLVSCYEDYEGYSVGQEKGKYNVTFVDPGTIAVPKDGSDFTLTLQRSENLSTEAIEVPLKVRYQDVPFEIPSTVKFAAGQSTADFTVTLPEILMNVPYRLAIDIDPAYADPYADQGSIYRLVTTVTKEDYEFFSKCHVNEAFWGESDEECNWDAEIEYSPELDCYRIKDMYVPGYPLLFGRDTVEVVEENDEGVEVKVRKEEVSLRDTDGSKITSWATGLSYGSYGAITAHNDDNTPHKYDAEKNEYTFTFNYKVSAGSFGSASIVVTLIE